MTLETMADKYKIQARDFVPVCGLLTVGPKYDKRNDLTTKMIVSAHFAVGFAAAFAIADKIEVLTRPYMEQYLTYGANALAEMIR